MVNGIRIKLPEFELASNPTVRIAEVRRRRGFYDLAQLKIYLKTKIIGTAQRLIINHKDSYIKSGYVSFKKDLDIFNIINTTSFTMIGRYCFKNCYILYYNSNIYYSKNDFILENVQFNFDSIEENFITNIRII
jgi:phosphomevalonate kinase